jgi:hypothetical protein
MQNNLRKLATDLNRCNKDWAYTNTLKDVDRKKLARSSIASMRNTVRAKLKKEIKRVEGELKHVL